MDYWAEARAIAPADVRRSLDWLMNSGFEVIETRGRPKSQGFLVRLVRPGSAVCIARDKGQWWCDLEVDGETHPLDVFVMAMGAAIPRAKEGTQLPEQLPEGILWSEELPRIFQWLDNGNRTAALGEARTKWQAENMRMWREDSPSSPAG